MRNEKGIVLMVAMMVLLILGMMGMAFLHLSLTETIISKNYTDHVIAFEVAEGGVAHARQQLMIVDVDALLLAGGNLFTGEALGEGTYSATVEAVGVNEEFLTITSTGRVRTARATIQVIVRRGGGFEADGAIYLPGTSAEVETKFGGDLFNISGNDTNLDGTPGTCESAPGIATTDDTLTAAITDGFLFNGGLTPSQFDNVTGSGPDPSVENVNTVYDVQEIITELLALPHTTVPNTGIAGNMTWGTDAAPQITYLDSPTVNLNGNVTGSGILIVPGTLKITTGASFDFHGLVIVHDEISLQPGAPTNITGTLWLAASSGLAPKLVELDPQGPANIKYSCEAIDMVNANWGTAFGGASAEIISWTQL